ncbi:MAG TPA: penicillin-binding transpeptidase domain-containing protein, partial [Bacillota bacterium]|nr:penicillin-binding transpeptidase domain-containing protein [Bacillota bacterium]
MNRTFLKLGIVLGLMAMIVSINVFAKDAPKNLDTYFSGYRGCFFLIDETNNRRIIYNQNDLEKRVTPCSTFKIVNSLIGLETGVLKDENTMIAWDGTKYDYPIWNRDQTLKTAVQSSVVWYFKEVARRIGEQRMASYLQKVGYGNQDLSGGIDRFWLSSTLKISPAEQMDLLQRLYQYQLPFSKRNIDIVKKILIQTDENGVVLSGKTGSATDGSLGWFIGYVERSQGTLFFVTKVEG